MVHQFLVFFLREGVLLLGLVSFVCVFVVFELLECLCYIRFLVQFCQRWFSWRSRSPGSLTYDDKGG